eukprot:3510911-Rhodomonas_salina.2
MSGTEIAYGGMPTATDIAYGGTTLRASYAMSGIRRSRVVSCYAMPCTEKAYDGSSLCGCYAASGTVLHHTLGIITEIAYGAGQSLGQ